MTILKPQISNFKRLFIAIEGNIGSGKTTLAKNLAAKISSELLLERFESNPYLRKFYQNREAYALPVELWFLINRYEQIRKVKSQPARTTEVIRSGGKSKVIISDYHISKCLIFAEANLNRKEFLIYKKYFMLIEPLLPQPDVLIYLSQDVSQLKKNILLRGREYEKKISPGYLNKIRAGYEKYIRACSTKKIVIDCSAIDLTKNDHIKSILKQTGLTSFC